MSELVSCLENENLNNVTTYIQSGNIIFQTPNKNISDLEYTISRIINQHFNIDVPNFVISLDNLKSVIDNNPFLDNTSLDPQFFYVSFLSQSVSNADTTQFENKKNENEQFYFRDNVFYLYCPDGYGKTKLTNNFIESKLKITSTTRNWKTVNELLKIGLNR